MQPSLMHFFSKYKDNCSEKCYEIIFSLTSVTLLFIQKDMIRTESMRNRNNTLNKKSHV